MRLYVLLLTEAESTSVASDVAIGMFASEDEAVGVSVRLCLAQFPKGDGWGGHQSAAKQIDDALVLAAADAIRAEAK